MTKLKNEELLEMSFQQRQVELELEELERQLAQKTGDELEEVLSLTKPFDLNVQRTEDSKPEKTEPENIREEVAKKEIKEVENPVAEADEVSQQSPEAENSGENELTEPVKDVEYWRKEAETWKKRKGDADRALTPAQQEAARLRKEKEEKEDVLLRRMNEIESLLRQTVKPPVHDEVETRSVSTIDDDFRETYPDIAERLEAIQRANELRVARAEAKTKEIETFFEKQRQEAENAKVRDEEVRHYLETKRLVPDIDDFIDQDKLGTPLVAWGQTQPQYKLRAILEPSKHDPSLVADVINQFKASTGMNSPKQKKPSLGDLATKASSATVVSEPVGEKLLSDEDFNNIDELLRQNAKNPKKFSQLVELYEQTAIHKSR